MKLLRMAAREEVEESPVTPQTGTSKMVATPEKEKEAAAEPETLREGSGQCYSKTLRGERYKCDYNAKEVDVAPAKRLKCGEKSVQVNLVGETGTRKESNDLDYVYDVGLKEVTESGTVRVHDLMRICFDRLESAAWTWTQLFGLSLEEHAPDEHWMRKVRAVVNNGSMVFEVAGTESSDEDDESEEAESDFEESDSYDESGASLGPEPDPGEPSAAARLSEAF